ncbi:hypothetical protein AcV5_005648 [Taiwanofungus camphoratus]|nr:hypothetical protein AcV5_005648 [Antrodia cinnamomea]KAI0948679.1 hypothetical protein AcV7_009352 [Antrodia cinnamomea]
MSPKSTWTSPKSLLSHCYFNQRQFNVASGTDPEDLLLVAVFNHPKTKQLSVSTHPMTAQIPIPVILPIEVIERILELAWPDCHDLLASLLTANPSLVNDHGGSCILMNLIGFHVYSLSA